MIVKTFIGIRPHGPRSVCAGRTTLQISVYDSALFGESDQAERKSWIAARTTAKVYRTVFRINISCSARGTDHGFDHRLTPRRGYRAVRPLVAEHIPGLLDASEHFDETGSRPNIAVEYGPKTTDATGCTLSSVTMPEYAGTYWIQSTAQDTGTTIDTA